MTLGGTWLQYDAVYEQVESMAYHHLSEMAIMLLSQRFSESIGRLFWSETGSYWCLPLVFILEDGARVPDSLHIWDARPSSSHLGVSYRPMSQWMRSIFEGQSHGFTVPWEF